MKNPIRTFCAWGLAMMMFAAMALAASSIAGGFLGIATQKGSPAILLLCGSAYWMFAAHLLFLLSGALQADVYRGRLSALARILRSKLVIGLLCTAYVGAFLHMFLAPRAS